MEFSKRLDLFGDEIFAALNERKVALEAQGRTIYNLSVGTPDFAPAEHIRKAMMDAAADPQNWKYSLRDLPELLEAVCGYYKRRFNVDTITPDEVMSFSGVPMLPKGLAGRLTSMSLALRATSSGMEVTSGRKWFSFVSL